MADYVKRERTVVQYRYVVRTPTNTVEVDKATAAARNDYVARWPSVGTPADDAISVIVEGDDIVVFWEEVKR